MITITTQVGVRRPPRNSNSWAAWRDFFWSTIDNGPGQPRTCGADPRAFQLTPQRQRSTLQVHVIDLVSDGAKRQSNAIKPERKRKAERLDKHQEAALVRRAQAGDHDTLGKLVLAFQPLVNKIASEFADSEDRRQELVSIVNAAGVIEKSVLKFDPKRGYRLATFLQRPITWTIKAGFRDRKPPPKVENTLRILFDVDGDDDFDERLAAKKLHAALARLDDRTQRIAIAHFGLGNKPAKTLKEISAGENISAERCRQILVNAQRKTGIPLGMRP